ncbi:T9SS C-terminal target domain-containing protein [Flavobacterium silvaticum]|uniref:T9SS C-terminal target domain-containing protein n=1 Tax=Flavobacterium silvaticum TaxID=1852020 RepID=A0A972JJF8_9FLAO|nr:T9SS C-terminal target domain-containing protein [Flavobacterium silvaticum]NMH28167.1 T9SS C-terminal target domain-containing protein [Flavobacterium silvaticum]
MPIRYYYLLLLLSLAASAQKNVFDPDFKRSAIKPSASFIVDGKIPEASGLVFWNDQLWTHNDGGHPATLFALDPNTASVVKEYKLPGIRNRDFEELTQDSTYFYLGDIGNNLGDTDTLHIYRIDKKSLIDSSKPNIEKLTFVWPETTNDGIKQKINFNCEAMVIINDLIYLFTKEHKTRCETKIFSIPKRPGKYTAKYIRTLKTKILVTGAYYSNDPNTLTLLGYSLTLRPFLLVFSNFKDTDFFSGDAKKIKIKSRFRQTEGIASDGNDFFVISEYWNFWFVHSRGRLFKLKMD